MPCPVRRALEHRPIVAPTDVVSRRSDARSRTVWPGDGARSTRDVDGRSSEPTSRREAHRRRDRQRRRIGRLRRTAALGLALLTVGAVVARSLQDPAVALPRPAVVVAAARAATDPSVAATSPDTPSPTGAASDQQPAAADDTTTDAEAAGPEPTAAAGATLPAVQPSASGSVAPLPIPAASFASSGRTVRFSVEAETGIEADTAEFARTVAEVLSDSRGWQAMGIRFVPVSPGEVAAGASVDIRVTLATPALTAALCAPLKVAEVQVSCWNRGRSVLNLQRWLRGAAAYANNLADYRVYLINHEVGHGLGHGHTRCAGAGRPAGIMVQQTLGLGGCTAWPWPTHP